MQKYGDYAPTGFDHKGAFLPDRQNWMVAPVGQTRDSGPLDRANFQSALEMLGGEGDTVEVHRFGHWGPGWIEIIIVDPVDKGAVDRLVEIEGSLESYPVLDDDLYSQLEVEEEEETWQNCYQGKFHNYLDDMMETLFEEGKISDGLINWYDRMEKADFDELFFEAMRGQSIYWEHDTDSCYIHDFDKVCEAVTVDEIVDLWRGEGRGKE